MTSTPSPYPPSSPDWQATRTQIRQALAEHVRSSLPPVALALAALYALLALTGLLMPSLVGLPPGWAALSALALGGLGLALYRRQPPLDRVYPLALVLALVVLVNCLWQLFLTRDPVQTTYLMLLLMGTGLLLLSRVWFLALLVLTLAGWMGVALALGDPFPWQHFGASLAIDALVALAINHVQIRNLSRLESLRLRETQRTRELQHQANHDPLTGLVNRRMFEEKLARVVAASQADGSEHALCYLDLDQFKLVNDTAGHAAGDELLRQLVPRLTARVRRHDTLARLGGDEFSLLLEHCPLSRAEEIAWQLVEAVREFRFAWEDRHFQVGVSVGVVPITPTAEGPGQILAWADVACYSAKDGGGNRVSIYGPGDGNGEARRHHGELRQAVLLRETLDERHICLHAQPIRPLASRDTVVHYELLLRLRDGERLITPGTFLSAAERYGLMSVLDRLVVRQALDRLPPLLEDHPHSRFGINLSGRTLSDATLLAQIRDWVAEGQVPPQRLCFEITETTAIRNPEIARHFITTLGALGCRFALDDFGSGLASFHYLKQLPVDYLKIDGSFISGVLDNPTDRAVVAAITAVGRVMGIGTIAECAPREALGVLAELGVDYAQGFDLGRPAPLEELYRQPVT